MTMMNALAGIAREASKIDGQKTATVAAVNSLLRKAGVDAFLRAGRGYYYWNGNVGFQWPSVYIYRMEQVNMAWMLDEIIHNVSQHSADTLPIR